MTTINVKKLTDLISSFYNLTGIKVAVFDSDFVEVLAYPPVHSPFCEMIHENRISRGECDKCMEVLCAKCAAQQTVIIEKCHTGLTEVIAPLTDGVSTIGYIMFGQFTNMGDNDAFVRDVTARCARYAIDSEQLITALSTIRYVSTEHVQDASKLLNALAVYIVFDKMAYAKGASTGYAVVSYIKENLKNDLSVQALCEKFYLSKSELYKITRPYMNETIAAFVKKERLAKAEDLLRYTDTPLWKIAENTGFSNVNYFLRTFKKEKGISAGKYRKNAAD